MKKIALSLLFTFCSIAAMNAQEQKQKQDTTLYQKQKNDVRTNSKPDTINKPNRNLNDTLRSHPPHDQMIRNDNTRTDKTKLKADTTKAKQPK